MSPRGEGRSLSMIRHSLERVLRECPEESKLNKYSYGEITIYNNNALNLYDVWDSPVVIVSDGPYGLNSFYGDLLSPEELPKWYEPHIKAWSEKAIPVTTLWLWNSEIGWALLHPLLVKYGWKYVHCNIWDKGIAHVAGNTNTKSLKTFPIVSEVCVQYVKEVRVNGMTLQQWLRHEWERSGLPLYKANKACGVNNAATRKYLTKDHLWYFPPADAFGKLVDYLNAKGRVEGRPYLSLDGKKPLTSDEWKNMKAKFHCKIGVTNVWRQPPLHGKERVKQESMSIHLNQKPLNLMELIVETSSDVGDLVWEPFGGLCTTAIAAYRLKRRCVSAEIEKSFYVLAVKNFKTVSRKLISNVEGNRET